MFNLHIYPVIQINQAYEETKKNMKENQCAVESHPQGLQIISCETQTLK